MSFRWSDHQNKFGVAGMIDSNGIGEEGKGTHGSLSPFDLHHILIAAGPDFRAGTTSSLPPANIDLAPTVLRILGVKPTQPLDGRVLGEAMLDGAAVFPTAESKTVEASRDLPTGRWRQYLRTSRVGASVYFDEGNGEARPK
jgi:arylsulfatase A-like enzyme